MFAKQRMMCYNNPAFDLKTKTVEMQVSKVFDMGKGDSKNPPDIFFRRKYLILLGELDINVKFIEGVGMLAVAENGDLNHIACFFVFQLGLDICDGGDGFSVKLYD